MFEILPVSSLEKVFPNVRPQLYEEENDCFCFETATFQFAFRCTDSWKECSYRICGISSEYACARYCELVAGNLPENLDGDDYVLSHEVTLYPDLLVDCHKKLMRQGQWNSLFVSVCAPAGIYKIEIEFFDETTVLGKCVYALTVYAQKLPKLNLKYTTWFHYDSLSEYYHLPIFSDEYNKMLIEYLKNYVAHGMNMLLTPIFTPALNTYVGGERTTAQLILVQKIGGNFKFDFTMLKWFMKLASDCGIENFEMAHLFTQWGAAAAPKIMCIENGENKRLFGWETKSESDEYFNFLRALLPQLTAFLQGEGYGTDCVYFHISDEPNGKYLEHYKKLRNFIKPLLGDYRIFDALSDYDFYKTGAVDIAVAATDSTEPFIKSGDKNYWVYYCCGQTKNYVSNRFFNMPLQRARIIGFQLYITGVAGFLHWGYNYYNTAFSDRYLNPFLETDAGGYFQSGDSFLVYPGKNGPLDSIRGEVMLSAVNDYRACQLLESKIGRRAAVQLLIDGGMAEDFCNYPKSAGWHTAMRKKINRLICENN